MVRMGRATLSVTKAKFPRDEENLKTTGVSMARDCKMGGLVCKSQKEEKMKVFESPQAWLELKDRFVSASRSWSEFLRGEHNLQLKTSISSFDDDLFGVFTGSCYQDSMIPDVVLFL